MRIVFHRRLRATKVVGRIFKAALTIRPRPSTRLPFTALPAIAEAEQPIITHDDEDVQMLTGDSAGPGSPAPLRHLLPRDDLQGQGQFSPKLPPLVEQYVVPVGPSAGAHYGASDFPMAIPGLPTSIASSLATTLAPETPRPKGPPAIMPSSAASSSSMGPPLLQLLLPRASLRRAIQGSKVQTEIDSILRDAEQRGSKCSEKEADARCHADRDLQGSA